ncbi:MAG: hypothetical protein OSB41_13885, partial [Kiritimatiellae bacterium]|nr:hypothetical protein [Kiritimatiellia bacterium]
EEVGVLFRQRLQEMERDSGQSMAEKLATFRRKNDSLVACASILRHTMGRGMKHPVRAARMVARRARQHLCRSAG